MNNKKLARLNYRFNNFQKAFFLLKKVIVEMELKELSDLEKEGFIQRFEYTAELSWKVMKDYLESQNLTFEPLPRPVIKKAYQTNLIENGETWLECLDTRNKMSHTYDFSAFEEAIDEIGGKYFPLFENLHEKIASFLKENSNG